MKVDKVEISKEMPTTGTTPTAPADPAPATPIDPSPENSRGAADPGASAPVNPPKAVKPKKVETKKEEVVLPGEEGLSPRQVEAKRKAEKEAKENPQPEEVSPDSSVDAGEEGFVTLEAADPKMTLEASVNDLVWVGNKITIPKKYEGTVRSLLNEAGMYVKN